MIISTRSFPCKQKSSQLEVCCPKITTGDPPYPELGDEEAEALYKETNYAPLDNLILTSVVSGCWTGTYRTSSGVLSALTSMQDDAQSTKQPEKSVR